MEDRLKRIERLLWIIYRGLVLIHPPDTDEREIWHTLVRHDKISEMGVPDDIREIWELAEEHKCECEICKRIAQRKLDNTD